MKACVSPSKPWRVLFILLALFSLNCKFLFGGGEPIEATSVAPQSMPIVPLPTRPETSPPFTTQGAVYYVAPNGDDDNPGNEGQPWRTIQKATDTLVAGETVYIRAGTYHEQVRLSRSGSEGQFITFAAYPGESPTVDAQGLTIDEEGGIFELAELSFIRISGLRLINSSGAGILAAQSSDILIEANYTFNTVSSGIGVWRCQSVIIDGNEVELANNDGQQENITVAGTDDFEVRYNHVHHGGPGSRGGEGIDVKDGSSDGKVYRNHVHDLPADLGIYVDAWDKHTYDIDIFQNAVHDNGGDGFSLASEAGGLLENIRIFNNLAFHNKYNGISLSGCCREIASKHPLRNLTIVNNTFYNNGWDEWGGGIHSENRDAQNVLVRNNIASQNLTFQIALEGVSITQYTIDHNLIDGFRDEPSETKGLDYVEGDPLFVDAARADFHLQPGSPAIENGIADSASSDDFEGNPRPQDGDSDGNPQFDIGAYETLPNTSLLYLFLVFCHSQDQQKEYSRLGGRLQ